MRGVEAPAWPALAANAAENRSNAHLQLCKTRLSESWLLGRLPWKKSSTKRCTGIRRTTGRQGISSLRPFAPQRTSRVPAACIANTVAVGVPGRLHTNKRVGQPQ
jgi:hypothetical protein